MDDYGIWDDGGWISWNTINAFEDDEPFDGPEAPRNNFNELDGIFRHLSRYQQSC